MDAALCTVGADSPQEAQQQPLAEHEGNQVSVW